MKAHESISDAQHIANKGNKCPFCGSNDIDADGFDSSGDEAWQSVTCNACQAVWVDSFKLVGYEVSEYPEDDGDEDEEDEEEEDDGTEASAEAPSRDIGEIL